VLTRASILRFYHSLWNANAQNECRTFPFDIPLPTFPPNPNHKPNANSNPNPTNPDHNPTNPTPNSGHNRAE